jgi:hypothetical protein
VAESASFCQVAKFIPLCLNDTDRTIFIVRQHNAAGRELCHWSSEAETWPSDGYSCAVTNLPSPGPASLRSPIKVGSL